VGIPNSQVASKDQRLRIWKKKYETVTHGRQFQQKSTSSSSSSSGKQSCITLPSSANSNTPTFQACDFNVTGNRSGNESVSTTNAKASNMRQFWFLKQRDVRSASAIGECPCLPLSVIYKLAGKEYDCGIHVPNFNSPGYCLTTAKGSCVGADNKVAKRSRYASLKKVACNNENASNKKFTIETSLDFNKVALLRATWSCLAIQSGETAKAGTIIRAIKRVGGNQGDACLSFARAEKVAGKTLFKIVKNRD